MNASVSRVELRNSEIIKKSKTTIPPPSTTVASLKSDTPRPGASNNGQNGSMHSKGKVLDKRKPNGHPKPRPGTSVEAVKVIPAKKRKTEAPPMAACPIDLIMDEMNNLESQKRKAKKKDDSDSESMKGMLKASTPMPGTFKAPTYLDLLRIESDNSMVFEFLNKRVPSVCEMVLAYKMLRGRVDNFNLTYFDRTKIKNLQNHIPPDEELLRELRGPEIFESELEVRHEGPRTPSGSPPSPAPPTEEKGETKYPNGFVPDDDQSSEAQERRKTEVKKYLAKRVNKDIQDVEAMLTEGHWKMMGTLKQELSFAMIDSMVEAAVGTTKDSNDELACNSPNGNSARNSVAMDISSNSSSIDGKASRTKNSKISAPISTPSTMPNYSQPPPFYSGAMVTPEILPASSTLVPRIQNAGEQSFAVAGASSVMPLFPPQPFHPPEQYMQQHLQNPFNPQPTSSNANLKNIYQSPQKQSESDIRYSTPQKVMLNTNPSQEMAEVTATPHMPMPTIPATTPFPQPPGPSPKNFPPRPRFAEAGKPNFRKPNQRGGMKKSQKRFQEFNNRPQIIEPKFGDIDMDMIRNRPPPPIPKIILEENKITSAPTPAAPTTFTAPFPATPRPSISGAQIQSSVSQLPTVLSPTHPPQGPTSTRPQTPQSSSGIQMSVSNSTPPSAPPRGPPSFRGPPTNSMSPAFDTPPPSRFPPRFPPPRRQMMPPPFASPMPTPPFSYRPPPRPSPDSSSVMRTLFSALRPNTIPPPAPPSIQGPPQFRPRMNIPRMPGPPRFRPHR